MKKKELYRLNDQLFARLEAAKAEIERLKKENNELLNNIKKFSEENQSEIIEQTVEPEKSVEKANEKVDYIPIDDITQCGAEVIGKIVINTAQFCQRLTGFSKKEKTKELINLILGRTEVAKAEILKIVNSDNLIDIKKSLIDKEYANAVDYFESVLAQI